MENTMDKPKPQAPRLTPEQRKLQRMRARMDKDAMKQARDFLNLLK
jgi:hypothetical protein